MKLKTMEVNVLRELVEREIELLKDHYELEKHELDMTLAFYEEVLIKLEVEQARLELLDELME